MPKVEGDVRIVAGAGSSGLAVSNGQAFVDAGAEATANNLAVLASYTSKRSRSDSTFCARRISVESGLLGGRAL